MRRLCRGVLRDLGVSEGCISDIALALTEACTNVLKHTDGGGGQYQVDIEVGASTCEVSVADTGAGFDHGLSRHEVPVAESGRGLHLMGALVDDLKFASRPGVNGTVVHLSKTLDLTDHSLLRAGRSHEGARGGHLPRRDAHLY